MPQRRKATDFFPSEEVTKQPNNTEESVEEISVDGRRTSELRRSARLHSSPVPVEQPSPRRKASRKSVLKWVKMQRISAVPLKIRLR